MASFNAARMYGLSHLGAIGSGYQADLVVLDDLEEVSVDSVYWKGKLVSRKGERPAVGKRTVPGFLLDTVQLRPVRREQLRLSCPDGAAHVAQVIPHQILTRHRGLARCLVPLENSSLTGTFRKLRWWSGIEEQVGWASAW